MGEGRKDNYNRGGMDYNVELSMEMFEGTEMERVWLEKLDMVFYYACSEITLW